MEADLPENIDAPRALVLEQSRILADERAAPADLAVAKSEVDAEVERLQSIITAFMRHRFGSRSEQLDPDSSSSAWKTSRRRWGTRERPAKRYRTASAASGHARPTAAHCLLILSGSNRLSMSRTRPAHAAAVRSIRSARM